MAVIMKFDIKGGHKLETSNINHLRELVEEIRENAKHTDLSKSLNDFCFSVETSYQAWHDLDEDNWDIVHE
jgi:predicted ATPase